MTKSEKIIWLTALVLSVGVFVYNLKAIPEEPLPILKEGEFYCLPQIQEQANKLKPNVDINHKINEYQLRIKNAYSDSDAWYAQVEMNNFIQQYNSQINKYNQFLQQNCR